MSAVGWSDLELKYLDSFDNKGSPLDIMSAMIKGNCGAACGRRY